MLPCVAPEARPAPAATRGQGLLLTLRWRGWAATFAFPQPVTPRSIQQQLPPLENCIGFHRREPPDPDPFPGLVPLPYDWPVPDQAELWVQPARVDWTDPAHQQVDIAGPDGRCFPFIVNIHLTPAAVLWPISACRTGRPTTWWERGAPGIGDRRLHDHIPLALQCIGLGSELQWNLAVETPEEIQRQGHTWPPFVVPQATEPPEEWASLPLEMPRSRSRSPMPLPGQPASSATGGPHR